MAQSAVETTTGKPDIAVHLAEHAVGADIAHLPREAVEATRTNLIDTLACAIAGSTAPGAKEVIGLVKRWGGAGEASILGFGGKVPAHHAAWANGTMAHARDYDDTHDTAVLHAGVSVVPAVLAAAEMRGAKATGADILAAITVGLDVVSRLGKATRLGITETGYMYTSLYGYFGATVAVGRIFRLDLGQMINAIGITYSQVAGNHQVTRDAALTKRMQPGFAAKAAIVSCELAARDIRGVQNTFDGLDGFLRVYLRNEFDRSVLLADLGRRYEGASLSYKPYPCCRHDHTAIDAALEARARWKPRPEDIAHVEVQVSKQAYEAVCTPVGLRKNPTSIVAAQFSIPYAVAAALIDGRVELGHFTDDGIRRPDILALGARVDGMVGAEIERDWGRKVSPANLTMVMSDGSRHAVRVDLAKGSVERPMSAAEFDAKVADCLRFAVAPLQPDAAARLREVVDTLERRDASAITACLVPAVAVMVD